MKNNNKERNRKKYGFTLLEILITTVLIFLLLSLAYSTLFSLNRVTAELENKMTFSETVFNFLNNFNSEIKCMIYEQEDDKFNFNSKHISFISKSSASIYPVKITYSVELSSDNTEMLYRKQENLLNGYAFSFPVFKGAEEINFNFHDGEFWSYSHNADDITAVALEIHYAGEKIFFPVKMYKEEPEDEE